MKKAIALLATLVVLTGTTFAQLAPSISGSAETKWGTNLDDETNGFEVSTDVSVTIPLTSGETVSTADAEGIQGKAEITGTTLTIDLNDLDFDDDEAQDIEGFQGDLGDISATIEFGNGAYMTVGSDSDLSTSKVSGDTDYDVNPDFGEDAGVSLGLKADAFSVELTIANEADGYERDGDDNDTDAVEVEDQDGYAAMEDVLTNIELVGGDDETESPANSEDAYVIGATASYSAGDIFGIDLAFATNATGSEVEDADVKSGLSLEATSKPMENLTVTLPFDYLTKDGNAAMELMPTVDVTAGDLEFGLDVHYISVAQELAPYTVYSEAVVVADAIAEVIPAGYTKYTIDGTEYLSNDGGVTLVVPTDVSGYSAAVDAVTEAADEIGYGLSEDFTATTLNASVAYTLALGDDSLKIGLDASDLLEDAREFAPSLTYTASAYNAKIATSYAEDELGKIEIDGGFTGIDNVALSVETTLQDGGVAFALDSLKVEYSGIANTTITAEYSGFATEDTESDDDDTATTGSFYIGAKISL